MFGRQNVDDDADQNKELDDQQAAYVSDLTAKDLLPPPPAPLPSVTPSSLTTSSVAGQSIMPTAGTAPVPAPNPVVQPTSFDVGSVVAGAEPIAGASPLPPETPTNQDQLLDIKHQALNELSPLITHLDQAPEEKFKTTMMLIQASDDATLINQAYEAAKDIADSKARAQALLDVVNEINYFTQHKQPQ